MLGQSVQKAYSELAESKRHVSWIATDLDPDSSILAELFGDEILQSLFISTLEQTIDMLVMYVLSKTGTYFATKTQADGG